MRDGLNGYLREAKGDKTPAKFSGQPAVLRAGVARVTSWNKHGSWGWNSRNRKRKELVGWTVPSETNAHQDVSGPSDESQQVPVGSQL